MRPFSVGIPLLLYLALTRFCLFSQDLNSYHSVHIYLNSSVFGKRILFQAYAFWLTVVSDTPESAALILSSWSSCFTHPSHCVLWSWLLSLLFEFSVSLHLSTSSSPVSLLCERALACPICQASWLHTPPATVWFCAQVYWKYTTILKRSSALIRTRLTTLVFVMPWLQNGAQSLTSGYGTGFETVKQGMKSGLGTDSWILSYKGVIANGSFYVKNLYAHCDVNGTVSVFVPWSFCETVCLLRGWEGLWMV